MQQEGQAATVRVQSSGWQKQRVDHRTEDEDAETARNLLCKRPGCKQRQRKDQDRSKERAVFNTRKFSSFILWGDSANGEGEAEDTRDS